MGLKEELIESVPKRGLPAPVLYIAMMGVAGFLKREDLRKATLAYSMPDPDELLCRYHIPKDTCVASIRKADTMQGLVTIAELHERIKEALDLLIQWN